MDGTSPGQSGLVAFEGNSSLETFPVEVEEVGSRLIEGVVVLSCSWPPTVGGRSAIVHHNHSLPLATLGARAR